MNKASQTLVWDWPIRAFHWLLVAAFSVLIFTGKSDEDYFQWHFYAGYIMSALIIARVLYGFFGSKYARFSEFVKGPISVLQYAKSLLSSMKSPTKGDKHAGHNPIGALMVVLLIVLLSAQWISGLFSSDEVFWYGPFYESASDDTLETMAYIHHTLPDIMLYLVAIHIAAVLFHELKLGERLVRAMITGRKSTAELVDGTDSASTPRIATIICLGLSLAWLAWLISLPI
ncbi:cytochrome b/b6 domain-containing protein [Marinomonas mediterranea]|uniref:cytochrome b/b6 domain-containing protein n=1 Tax=Marinomonas mediterranea TaxID=119864 RepID=UPI00234BDF81|nr:cytochrome b/b6 domain-containing protein [Marinomonas mediterranea]WCN10564.1 branched-chain alpha-keto acid dehydrogenase subunit E2 [Marinomonas mediterranea]